MIIVAMSRRIDLIAAAVLLTSSLIPQGSFAEGTPLCASGSPHYLHTPVDAAGDAAYRSAALAEHFAPSLGDLAPRHSSEFSLVEIEKAIRAVWGDAASDWKIEVLKTSLQGPAMGHLEFSPPQFNLSLAENASAAILMTGKLAFENGKTNPVWARVRIRVVRALVRTRVRVLAGHVLEADQLEMVRDWASPLVHPQDDSLATFLGMRAVRTLAAGTLLSKLAVEPAPVVHRGERVQVSAIAGQARLRFEARAKADGRRGDVISLLNLRSGRTFRGMVTGTDQVVLKLNVPQFNED